MNKPEIISEALCNYALAAVIILKHKGIDYTVTHIDPEKKQAWLDEVTPIKRLPLLKAENRTVFGTFAFCEYLDEAYPHSIQPKKAIDKAVNRSWIEFSVTLKNTLNKLVCSSCAGSFAIAQNKLSMHLSDLDEVLNNRPFFNGERFSVVDAIYAPLLHRMVLLKQHYDLDLLADFSRLRSWYEELSVLEEVRKTLTREEEQRYLSHVLMTDGYFPGH